MEEFVVRPRLVVLTDSQIGTLLDGALKVLDSTGIEVLDRDAFVTLKRIGARVSGETRVFPSRAHVEAALASAPKQVTIFDRLGRPVMRLGGENTGGLNTYYGTGSDLRHTYDLQTGKRRLTVSADIAAMATVADACEHIDFLMSYGIPSDVDLRETYRREFLEMVSHATKPICFTSDDGQDSRHIIAMAAVVAGGAEALRERPFVMNYAQPTSPLQHSADAIGKVLACAEAGVPVCFPPGLIPGATAPCTVAGAATQSLAESLSMLVLHQAHSPGAPFIAAGAHGCFDMRTMVNVYAAPERLLSQAVLTSFYQHVGLPTWGFGGCSDAKCLDEQAAMESALLALWAGLTGVNLAHDTGYLASGMAGDLRALVLNNEINSYVRHVLRTGAAFNSATRALDAISRVGPGGNFLADQHTLEHFLTGLWSPALLDRDALSTWEQKDEPSFIDRLTAQTRDILAGHTADPLPGAMARRLRDMARAG